MTERTPTCPRRPRDGPGLPRRALSLGHRRTAVARHLARAPARRDDLDDALADRVRAVMTTSGAREPTAVCAEAAGAAPHVARAHQSADLAGHLCALVGQMVARRR